MTAPALPPAWDTNDTNIAGAIEPAHETDGYDVGEVPTSTELNLILQLIIAFVRYLATFPRPEEWQWLPAGSNPSNGPLSTAGTGSVAQSGVTYSTTSGIVSVAAGGQFSVKIEPKVGEIIDQLGIVAAYVSGHSPLGLNLTLVVVDKTTGAIDQPSGGTVSTSTASTSLAKLTGTMGTPYTTVDGEAYYILVTNPDGFFSTVGECTTVGYASSFNV
jgi:hypothetical protein